VVKWFIVLGLGLEIGAVKYFLERGEELEQSHTHLYTIPPVKSLQMIPIYQK
jgi:hypothetical protein